MSWKGFILGVEHFRADQITLTRELHYAMKKLIKPPFHYYETFIDFKLTSPKDKSVGGQCIHVDKYVPKPTSCSHVNNGMVGNWSSLY